MLELYSVVVSAPVSPQIPTAGTTKSNPSAVDRLRIPPAAGLSSSAPERTSMDEWEEWREVRVTCTFDAIAMVRIIMQTSSLCFNVVGLTPAQLFVILHR